MTDCERKTRVVVVDDSSLSRAILREILEAEGDIEVVAEASNGYDAVATVDAFSPDVVTMDIDMPGPNGLDTIGFVMSHNPRPILVVTGERLGDGSALGFHALERGAVDFTSKPSITDRDAVRRLRSQVRAIAGMRVLRPDAPSLAPPDCEEVVAQASRRYGVELVAFGAGIGGHRSLMRILRRIPRDIPCAIAVVQHMAPKFGAAFARYLQQMTALPVRLTSRAPQSVTPGAIYVGDAAAHLVCKERGVLAAVDGSPLHGYQPSISLFFGGIAEIYGKAAVGVLCAGSGDDGVDALGRLRKAGGLALVESPDTATPNDMPRAAMRTGAVDRALPAELVADYLVGILTDRGSKTTAPPSDEGSA